MNEHEAYSRLGASGAVIGIVGALLKMGVFRAIRAWWKRPTDTEKLSRALHDVSESVNKMGAVMRGVDDTLKTLSDKFIIAEAMMRFLGDADTTPMFQCELPSGNCIWSNKAIQELFGRTAEQMRGSGWAEAILPEFQEKTLQHWKYAVVNSDIYNCDYPIEKSGKIINLRAHADFVKDATGRKIIAIGTVRPTPVMLSQG